MDYDTRNPYGDYAYCTFSWCIVEGDIYLIYDDDAWSVMYIKRYRLTDRSFSGHIYDKYNPDIYFDFVNSTYDGWGNYGDNGGYGGFENQRWFRYRARTRAAADVEADVPFLDRTEQAIKNSGEKDAVSVASGVFAEAMKRQQAEE